jgi:hypothetical protein
MIEGFIDTWHERGARCWGLYKKFGNCWFRSRKLEQLLICIALLTTIQDLHYDHDGITVTISNDKKLNSYQYLQCNSRHKLRCRFPFHYTSSKLMP